MAIERQRMGNSCATDWRSWTCDGALQFTFTENRFFWSNDSERTDVLFLFDYKKRNFIN